MTAPILSLKPLPKAWNDFWHVPCDVRVCAVIRICWAILIVLNFLGAYPWVELWWSESGFMPLAQSKRMLDPDVWSLFHYLPATNKVLWACYTAAVVQAGLVIAGVATRFNILCTLVWLVTFQHRNPLITDGEDTVFRVMGFLLLFMPVADRWSIDAKLFPRAPDAPARHGWALRMLQVQMFMILWAAGLEKLAGGSWWSGAAMYYVMHLNDFYGHFPVPTFLEETVWLQRALTWVSLWIELLGPPLCFFKETRRYALLAVIGLHLGIEYMMNVFLFEWVMIAGWLSFMLWDDVDWLKGLFAKLFSKPGAETQPAPAS